MAALISKLSVFWILLLFSSTALATEPAPAPIADTMGGEGCKDALLSVSRCLPYISAPPNNVSSIAPPECCDAFSSIFYAGNVFCLCYFHKNPQLFGFPIEDSKLLSLSSVCLRPNVTSPENATSVELNCSVLHALSPLGSADYGPLYPPIAGPIASPPSITSPPDSSPSSMMIITSEESDNSPFLPPESDTEFPTDFLDSVYPHTSAAIKPRITFSGFFVWDMTPKFRYWQLAGQTIFNIREKEANKNNRECLLLCYKTQFG